MTGSGGLAAVHAQHIGNHVEQLANIAAAVAAFRVMAGVRTSRPSTDRRATRSLGLPVRDEDFQLQPA
jgi:hypothetical protein